MRPSSDGYVDLRKSIDDLSAIVSEHGHDVYSGHLYVFSSRRGDRIKILTWEAGGFVLYYVTTGQLGDQFHRITGVPGTTPHRLPSTDRRRGQGSPQATSGASLPSTETRTVQPRAARVIPTSPVEVGTRVRWRRWFRYPRRPVATLYYKRLE